MKSLFSVVLGALLLGIGFSSCGGDDGSSDSDGDSDSDSDSDSDGDSDGDSDSDSDGDSDSDSDSDCSDNPSYVACEGTPTSCSDIGDQDAQGYGCCDGSWLFYCFDDVFTSYDCVDSSVGNTHCCYDWNVHGMNCTQ